MPKTDTFLGFSSQNRIKKIALLIHFIALSGLILSLGDLLNWYQDQDRINFYQIVEKDHRCPAGHPGAKKFLAEYFYNEKLFYNSNSTEEEKNKEPEMIIFTGLFEKGNGLQETLSGSIRVKTKDGFPSRQLSSYEELKNWAHSSPKFWVWIAWGVLAIGVLAEIAISILEKKTS